MCGGLFFALLVYYEPMTEQLDLAVKVGST